ncbi:MAG: hypothetical protein PHS73_00120 [Candidatus Peribacteraceae bacterium]|nr:hypothetical protein [Candidatus Peribacteraceae bacterium]
MPHFTYSAITKGGELQEGTMEAISMQAARDAIREMQLTLEEIHESTAAEQAEFTTSAPPLPAASAAPAESPQGKEPPAKRAYFPLIDTLRLYAGWLLAWYAVVYAFGSYQHLRPLPFQIPYLTGLSLSPLVLQFALGAFLFLLCTGLWKRLGKNLWGGLLLTASGVAGFVLYRMNVL